MIRLHQVSSFDELAALCRRLGDVPFFIVNGSLGIYQELDEMRNTHGIYVTADIIILNISAANSRSGAIPALRFAQNRRMNLIRVSTKQEVLDYLKQNLKKVNRKIIRSAKLGSLPPPSVQHSDLSTMEESDGKSYFKYPHLLYQEKSPHGYGIVI